MLSLFLTHLEGYKKDAIKSPILITLEVICELILPLVMALTSLVIRVMREAEENRSMSAKENSCTLSNRHWRRLAPKPWLAKVAYFAEPTPQAMAKRDNRSIRPPIRKM